MSEPEVRRLLREVIVGAVGVVALVGALGLFFREPLVAAGEAFVDVAGIYGVFAAFLVLDTVWLPIPHDTFSGLALLGGLDFWSITLAGGCGSVVGGSLAFALSQKLGRSVWFMEVMYGRGQRARLIVARWGAWGVALGALTPLPYSLCAWIAGTFQMRWLPFLGVSLLRFPRVAFYLWLMQIGLLPAG